MPVTTRSQTKKNKESVKKGSGGKHRAVASAASRGSIKSAVDALTDNVTCTVCMLFLRRPVQLQPCLHVFCNSCISKWLMRKRTCPCCRSQPVLLINDHAVGNVLKHFVQCASSDLKESLECDREGITCEMITKNEMTMFEFIAKYQRLLRKVFGRTHSLAVGGFREAPTSSGGAATAGSDNVNRQNNESTDFREIDNVEVTHIGVTADVDLDVTVELENGLNDSITAATTSLGAAASNPNSSSSTASASERNRVINNNSRGGSQRNSALLSLNPSFFDSLFSDALAAQSQRPRHNRSTQRNDTVYGWTDVRTMTASANPVSVEETATGSSVSTNSQHINTSDRGDSQSSNNNTATSGSRGHDEANSAPIIEFEDVRLAPDDMPSVPAIVLLSTNAVSSSTRFADLIENFVLATRDTVDALDEIV